MEEFDDPPELLPRPLSFLIAPPPSNDNLQLLEPGSNDVAAVGPRTPVHGAIAREPDDRPGRLSGGSHGGGPRGLALFMAGLVLVNMLGALGHVAYWRTLRRARAQLDALSARVRELEERSVGAVDRGACALDGAGADWARADEPPRLPATVQPVATLLAHVGIVTAVEACGGLLISAGADGLVQAWAAAPPPRALGWGRERKERAGTGAVFAPAFVVERLGVGVRALHASVDERGACAKLSAGTWDGQLIEWRIDERARDATRAQSWRAHAGGVQALLGTGGAGSAPPGAELLLSGGRNGSLSLWALSSDRATRTLRARLGAHKGAVRALALAAGGLVLSGGEDGALKLWRLTPTGARSVLSIARAHRSGGVAAIALPPPHAAAAAAAGGAVGDEAAGSASAPSDELVVFSASTDGELKLWRLHAPAARAADDDAVAARRDGARELSSSEAPALVEVGAHQLKAGVAALLASATRAGCVYAGLVDGRVQLVCTRLEPPGAQQGGRGGAQPQPPQRQEERRRAWWLEADFVGHAGWVGALAQLDAGRFVSGADDASVRVWDGDAASAAAPRARERGSTASEAPPRGKRAARFSWLRVWPRPAAAAQPTADGRAPAEQPRDPSGTNAHGTLSDQAPSGEQPIPADAPGRLSWSESVRVAGAALHQRLRSRDEF
jgi:WD40 repeat protein